MLILPKKIRLFSQTWWIRAARPGEIGDDLGQCRPDQFEIVINHCQETESVIHTIVHELCHAIEIKQNLEMTERQVDLMALGIIDLLRNNDGIVELITDDVTDVVDILKSGADND